MLAFFIVRMFVCMHACMHARNLCSVCMGACVYACLYASACACACVHVCSETCGSCSIKKKFRSHSRKKFRSNSHQHALRTVWRASACSPHRLPPPRCRRRFLLNCHHLHPQRCLYFDSREKQLQGRL